MTPETKPEVKPEPLGQPTNTNPASEAPTSEAPVSEAQPTATPTFTPSTPQPGPQPPDPPAINNSAKQASPRDDEPSLGEFEKRIGNSKIWKLICARANGSFGERTTALEVDGLGVIVRVESVAAGDHDISLVFVPGASITPCVGGGHKLEAAGFKA